MIEGSAIYHESRHGIIYAFRNNPFIQINMNFTTSDGCTILTRYQKSLYVIICLLI